MTDPAEIRDPIGRFLAKVEWGDNRHRGTRCLMWTGAKRRRGYGAFWADGGLRSSHRWLYERWFGSIPDGLHVDHLCRVPACVNPAHLEVVTQRENTLRGRSMSADNARKTECKNGHEFTEENTYVYSDGRRSCRVCRKAAWEARWTRTK